MRVSVIFEFPEIKDPNGPDADRLADLMTWHTQQWREKLDANAVWVDDICTSEDEEEQ